MTRLRVTPLLLLLLACPASQPAGPVHSLPAVGLQLQASGPVLITTVRDTTELTLRSGARSPVVLRLTRSIRNGPEGAFTLRIAPPLQGRYSVERAAGGSGGEEVTVYGQIKSPAQSWQFTCHAQSESGSPESACLSLLASLRPSPERDAATQ